MHDALETIGESGQSSLTFGSFIYCANRAHQDRVPTAVKEQCYPSQDCFEGSRGKCQPDHTGVQRLQVQRQTQTDLLPWYFPLTQKRDGQREATEGGNKWLTKPQPPSVCSLSESLWDSNKSTPRTLSLASWAGLLGVTGPLGGHRLLPQPPRTRYAVQLGTKHLLFCVYPHRSGLGQKIPVQHLHAHRGKQ